MTKLIGFLSYVHEDDQSDNGRITRLGEDIKNQYQMLSGEKVELFIDRNSIEVGENWRDKIENAISSIVFFIPVITPRYFMSPECRGELQKFVREVNNIGYDELVIPIYYVTVPEMGIETTTDDLISLVSRYQYEDWRELRFSDCSSEPYRKAVHRLATRFVEANKHIEASSIKIPEQLNEISTYDNDDAPGTIESLAKSEEMLAKFPDTLDSITNLINQIGQISQESSDEITQASKRGGGYSVKLLSLRKASKRMEDPIDQIWELSKVYATQLHDIDIGFRIIINQAKEEAEIDPNAKIGFCKFADTVINLSLSSSESMDSIKYMISSFEPLEKLSRDLRQVLRRLSKGLTNMIEASEVIQEWVNMIETSDIKCDESPT